jgi:hypothetical protein
MDLWAKIKCIFGYCDELDEIEMKQRMAVDAAYGVKPVVQTVKTSKITEKAAKKIADITSEIKVEKARKVATKKPVKAKVKEAVKTKVAKKTKPVAKKIEKATKVKRHWYNNAKTQKLVIEGEETSLPKTWKKGKLPKVKKD